jgi:hypothetical protein
MIQGLGVFGVFGGFGQSFCCIVSYLFRQHPDLDLTGYLQYVQVTYIGTGNVVYLNFPISLFIN